MRVQLHTTSWPLANEEQLWSLSLKLWSKHFEWGYNGRELYKRKKVGSDRLTVWVAWPARTRLAKMLALTDTACRAESVERSRDFEAVVRFAAIIVPF